MHKFIVSYLIIALAGLGLWPNEPKGSVLRYKSVHLSVDTVRKDTTKKAINPSAPIPKCRSHNALILFTDKFE